MAVGKLFTFSGTPRGEVKMRWVNVSQVLRTGAGPLVFCSRGSLGRPQGDGAPAGSLLCSDLGTRCPCCHSSQPLALSCLISDVPCP